jgi:hypothetical protein
MRHLIVVRHACDKLEEGVGRLLKRLDVRLLGLSFVEGLVSARR